MITLLTLRLGNQKILEGWETLNEVLDANDVAKLLLALVFVLDGIGRQELDRYNSQQARPRDRVKDPFRPIIGAINSYLRAYHVYRAEALSLPEIGKLGAMSSTALENLQTA